MSIKIGIPRGLMYYYYYPAWRVFFEELGLDVLLSPETNKGILDQGVRMAVDDICLPFKVYYGHVLSLKEKADYLFVPRFISLGNYNYVCPKFMGLPDILKASIDKLPELIEPVIDLRKGSFPVRRIAREIGKNFTKSFWSIEKAYRKGRQAYRKFVQLQVEGIDNREAMELVLEENNKRRSSILGKRDRGVTEEGSAIGENKIEKKDKGINIGVIGHSYLLNDPYISMKIIEHLREMGANIFTVEMHDHELLEKAASVQNKQSFWYFNRQVMGAAYHLLREKRIHGLVQVTAFGCGPDSMIKELIDIKGKRNKLAILNVNLDEHSGEAGLLTRLEAFMDLIERRETV